MIDAETRSQMITALQWYTEQGLDVCLLDETVDRLKYEPEAPAQENPVQRIPIPGAPPQNVMEHARQTVELQPERTFLGKAEACDEAIRLAKGTDSLEELSQAIAEFEGITLKKTASNMVFGAGNPKADVMLVGEAPGADEDRQGVPFVGVHGQLLDRILSCIDLDREEKDPQKSVYMSNILNWRPPGNRTPSPAEIEVSLPFAERHIQLVKPKVLILCGGVAAKALLGREQSISRLRKSWHEYVPVTSALGGSKEPIPAIATYHPSYLLRTPAQKKLVWADMLAIRKKLQK